MLFEVIAWFCWTLAVDFYKMCVFECLCLSSMWWSLKRGRAESEIFLPPFFLNQTELTFLSSCPNLKYFFPSILSFHPFIIPGTLFLPLNFLSWFLSPNQPLFLLPAILYVFPDFSQQIWCLTFTIYCTICICLKWSFQSGVWFLCEGVLCWGASVYIQWSSIVPHKSFKEWWRPICCVYFFPI